MTDATTEQFCVLSGDWKSCTRTMSPTQAAAAEHGRTLLRRKYAESRGAPVKVYVVKIVEVLTTGEPVITSRPPTADDAADLEGD